jgi:hypothetical protein
MSSELWAVHWALWQMSLGAHPAPCEEHEEQQWGTFHVPLRNRKSGIEPSNPRFKSYHITRTWSLRQLKVNPSKSAVEENSGLIQDMTPGTASTRWRGCDGRGQVAPTLDLPKCPNRGTEGVELRWLDRTVPCACAFCLVDPLVAAARLWLLAKPSRQKPN